MAASARRGAGDEDFTQWTDVRDLADFTLHAIENHLDGTYNVSRGATFRELLQELATLGTAPAELTWVSARDRNVAPSDAIWIRTAHAASAA